MPRPELTFHLDESFKDLVPAKAYSGDLGYDFKSPLDFTIPARGFLVINTMVAMTMPSTHGMLLASRSGLASKGIVVRGGVIDSSYRGFIKIILANESDSALSFQRGQKIAQGILVPIVDIPVSVSYKYPDENVIGRGSCGFGSTG